MTEKKVGRYHCVLTLTQKIKVVDWLRDKWEQLLGERPRYSDLAARIASELSLPLNARVLRDICHSIGLAWESPKGGGPHLTGAWKEEVIGRLVALEETLVNAQRHAALLQAEVAQVRQQQDHLIAACKQLYRDAGIVPHPSYGWPLDHAGLPK